MKKWRTNATIFFLFAILALVACATSGISPENKMKAIAARNLGEAYLGEGKVNAALAELLKAEKLDPMDPIVHNDLGLAYMAKEKIDLATTHFEKAVELNPGYSVAKNNLGSAYLISKEWDKAIHVLESVTGDLLYATPERPLSNLGWAYYNKEEYEKARECLNKALDLQPDFFQAQLNLGMTDLATGRLNNALAVFEKAAKTQPKNPILLLEMGKTYRLLGDYTNAILALKGAIAYTEDGELAVKANEELQKIQR